MFGQTYNIQIYDLKIKTAEKSSRNFCNLSHNSISIFYL
jgi:hypothetical protein